MRKTRAAAAVTAVAALAAVGLSVPATAAPPKQVMICHFDDHTATESWSGGGTTLNGDYVLKYTEGGPTEDQVNYCLSHGGEGVIWVSENALQGHDAQLQDRVSQYPAG